MFCGSGPPAFSSTPLPPSVHYPSLSLVFSIKNIQTFCEHLSILFIFDQTDWYCFYVRRKRYALNACLVVSPLSLSPSHPPTLPPRRWPALTTLPPLPKFQLFGCGLCEALLSSSSLVGQKHPSLLSRLGWDAPDIQVVLPWTWRLNRLSSSIIFGDMDVLTAM